MSLLHETDLYELPAATPADRARLRRVIDDVQRLEKLAALRTLFVGVIAFLSLPLWIHAAFPRVMPGAAVYFIAAWVPATLGFIAVLVADWLTRRRARQHADCTTDAPAELHPATRRPS